MKKFLKFITGRLFLTVLIVFVEIAIIVTAIALLVVFVTGVGFIGELLLIILVVSFVLSICIIFYIVNSKAHDSYKIGWLVVVGAIPLFGSVFYLLFANKKFTKKERRKARAMRAIFEEIATKPEVEKKVGELDKAALLMSSYISKETGSPLCDNTEATYYPFGQDAFPVMLEELRKAKHYIFLEYFIIQEGLFWNSILEILEQKAKEGLDVRVLYDDVGSVGTLPSNYFKKLREKGIRSYSVNRLSLLMSIRVNNRDHRKIMVIDGHTGFTGGINLADEYINKVERFGVWKDNAIMLKGEGVYGLTQMFLGSWLMLEVPDKPTIFDDYAPYVHLSEMGKINSSGYIQPYGDIPFNYSAIGENIYLHLIERAEKYVWISTPYLIIDSELQNALCNAAIQGVDVRILMPGIPDKKVVFSLAHSYYKALLEAGVKIYEYSPGFVHMKMFVVDDIYATCGTVNLDYRSLFLHLECGTFIFKAQCISDMKKDFELSFNDSREIKLADYRATKWYKRVWWGILRVFAPLL